ncbi:metallopeptidase family protein [Oceaniglobus indicus]|uniref:metallopeptidase family protein n=1 Tax=Oceaniglobus indicus TaxID=2047749 RepID=UPI000C195FD2|nr:metallopeptidase family protein [Oceaniglobus indicus]
MTQDHRLPPDLAAIERLAETARASLPAPFAQAARDVAIQVVDFAPDHVLREFEDTDPFALTGLYDGIPLTEKSSFDQPGAPDTIWLFRRPILDEWCDRGDIELSDLVTHIYVHELAHHLGWSDDDIASIDRWWE